MDDGLSKDGVRIWPDNKLRTCLGCGIVFRSLGPWNRMCTDCNERASRYGRLAFMATRIDTTDPCDEVKEAKPGCRKEKPND